MSPKIINSPNFKKWFGDWENNPESASKVVDENGLPLVVYHGTDADFNEFSSKFIGQLGTQHGQGFYFTSNKKFAGNFGKNIKSFFLNIRKPLSTNELTLSYNDCIKLMDAVDKKQCEADPEFGYGILSDYGDVDSEGRESVLKSAADLEYSSSDNDVEIVGSLINASGDYNIVVNTLHELFGYDGIMCPEKEIYVIHHPNQAKEISNQLFNPESNNMYESKKTKRIFVTESQLEMLKQHINESDNNYFVDTTKVLIVKKFMDKMFSRGKMDSMSPNGYPTKTNVVGMKGNDGNVIKNMSFEQVLDLLEDKFHYIYTNEEKRSRFLKQVLEDWYNKKITREGLLSKNSY